MWASAAEYQAELDRLFAPTFSFRVYDEFDDGEFGTSAKVDLIERGKVVHTEQFFASREDAPGPAFSDYYNGRDNDARTQARSYAWAWLEHAERGAEAERLSVQLGREVHPLELADAREFEREQNERAEVYA